MPWRGRSLREFDLEDRLFQYPLSYLIYSEAFEAMPGDQAILEIRDDTKPDFRESVPVSQHVVFRKAVRLESRLAAGGGTQLA